MTYNEILNLILARLKAIENPCLQESYDIYALIKSESGITEAYYDSLMLTLLSNKLVETNWNCTQWRITEEGKTFQFEVHKEDSDENILSTSSADELPIDNTTNHITDEYSPSQNIEPILKEDLLTELAYNIKMIDRNITVIVIAVALDLMLHIIQLFR